MRPAPKTTTYAAPLPNTQSSSLAAIEKVPVWLQVAVGVGILYWAAGTKYSKAAIGFIAVAAVYQVGHLSAGS